MPWFTALIGSSRISHGLLTGAMLTFCYLAIFTAAHGPHAHQERERGMLFSAIAQHSSWTEEGQPHRLLLPPSACQTQLMTRP